MKINALLCVAVACAPLALASTNPQAQVLDPLLILKSALLNTDKESITSHVSEQIQDTIISTDEVMVFMKNNATNINISDFRVLYRETMKKSQIQKFDKSVGEHGAKSILLAATSQYSDSKNDCDVEISNFSNGLGQFYKKLSVTCSSGVYGENHWIPLNHKITDTYYISSFDDDTPKIESIEFGLLSKHKENIATLVKKIEKGINDEFI